MITKGQVQKIKRFALHLDWGIAFKGKSRGNRHLFRVCKIASKLAEKEGGDKSIIIAASWLHDVGLIRGDKNHEKNGKNIAKKFLVNLDLNKEDTDAVLHCIETHEGNARPGTKEAELLHDADVLDKMGPLGIIRQTLKLANSGTPVEKVSKILRPYLLRRKNILHTRTAKAMAKTLDRDMDKFFESLKLQLSGSSS